MVKIQTIQQKIIERDYYLSSHAEDEMIDDNLDRTDIENAIFKGRIEKKLTQDIRGTGYRIEGPSKDGRTTKGLVEQSHKLRAQKAPLRSAFCIRLWQTFAI